MLTEPGERIGGGLLAFCGGAQLLQALADQVGRLGVVVDVIAKGGLVGQRRSGVTPAAQHLHELNLQVAVVRQPSRVFLYGEPPTKFSAIHYRHAANSFSPQGSAVKRGATQLGSCRIGKALTQALIYL